jgi:hypothetical protein
MLTPKTDTFTCHNSSVFAGSNEQPLSPTKIREALRHATVGSKLHAVIRHDTNEVVHWYGEIYGVTGTSTRPSWKVRFFASAAEGLFFDDNDNIVNELGILPLDPKDQSACTFVEMITNPPTRGNVPCIQEEHAVNAPIEVREPEEQVADKVDFTEWTTNEKNANPYAPVMESVPELANFPWKPACDAPIFGSPNKITGESFCTYRVMDFENAKRKCPSSVVWSALTEATRRSHISELLRLQSYLMDLPRDIRELPLDSLLVRFADHERIRRKLLYSSAARVGSNLVGALCALPFYTERGISMMPAHWPFFKAYLQATKRLTSAQGVHEPMAAEYSQVKAALQRLDTDREKTLLILCWFSVQRPCDILHTECSCLNAQDEAYTVRVKEGKVIGRIGTQIVHFRIQDSDAATIVNRHLERQRTAKHKYVFPLRNGYQRSKLMGSVLKALREVHPQLEMRSLRRGSLQCLAKAGLSENELLTYSRHTGVEQLRRYLGAGAVLAREAQNALSKTTVLADVRGGGNQSSTLEEWAELVDDEIILSCDRAPPMPTQLCDRTGYSLHARIETKTPMQLEKLDEIAIRSGPMGDSWSRERQWLNDAHRYTCVPFDGTLSQSHLDAHQLAKLVEVGNIEEVPKDQQHKITGSVHVFLVPEDAKKRWRVIKHPVAANNFYAGKLEAVRNTTRRSAREAVMTQEGCIALDFLGYYDQFPYSDDVSFAHCFRANGKVFRTKRLTMGGRASSSVATAATQMLAACAEPSVAVDTSIDNVRFAGPKDDVVKSVCRFLTRCGECGAKLHDVDAKSFTRKEVEKLYTTSNADFFGEVADYANKTVKCRARHLERLATMTENCFRQGATYAAQFAMYAMLLYISETLGLELHSRLPIRLFFVSRARELAKDVTLWHSPATTFPPRAHVMRWVQQASQNVAGHLRRLPPSDTVVFGDACKLGYAGIICTRIGDTMKTTLIQRRWDHRSQQHLDFSASTVSEPEAAVRLIREAKRISGECPGVYVTDHTPFIHAMDRGCSTSPGYNSRVAAMKRFSPATRFEYLEGPSHYADVYSRMESEELTDDIRRRVEADTRQILSSDRDSGYCIVGVGGGGGWSSLYRAHTGSSV